MISDRIKRSRERVGMTQAELARRLGITRSSVNAWEMGISVPSTKYIVQLAELFNVSTDYLLCLDANASINVSGLDDEEVLIVHTLVENLRKKR